MQSVRITMFATAVLCALAAPALAEPDGVNAGDNDAYDDYDYTADGQDIPLGLVLGQGYDQVLVDDEAVRGISLRAGFDYRPTVFYARATAGLMLSAYDEHRKGIELVGALGLHPYRWFYAGVTGGWRRGSTEVFETALENMWFVGVESLQCFAASSLIDYCFVESFAPFGERSRRGLVEDGEVFFVPRETDSLMRVHLGISLRYAL